MPSTFVDIIEIRLLPPIGIARFGSAQIDTTDPERETIPHAMSNYDVIDDGTSGWRAIVPASTLILGFQNNPDRWEVIDEITEDDVRFRNADGQIHPIAPFFELWGRLEANGPLIPLTSEHVDPEAVHWEIEVANRKVFRRTQLSGDIFSTEKVQVRDHRFHELKGSGTHLLEDKTIPFGDVVYPQPNDRFPQIRLRFYPGRGKVYAHEANEVVPEDRVVYDASRTAWVEYETSGGPFPVEPAPIERAGHLDDSCDGFIRVRIDETDLSASARVSAAPPDFAPDSFPVRSALDELEQLFFGPDVALETFGEAEIERTIDVVRRAIETVRLMNTEELNQSYPGPRRDGPVPFRASRAFFQNAETIHKRWLDAVRGLALAQDNPARFTRAKAELEKIGDNLRDYLRTHDMSPSNRRKMPAMMRGADRGDLALTRRQSALIRTAATLPAPAAAQPVQPLNLTAQLQFRASGNGPSTVPAAAISNCYPGLEFDLRNLWTRSLQGIVLHEVTNEVVQVDDDMPDVIKALAGEMLRDITLPDGSSVPVAIPDQDDPRRAVERGNAFISLIEHAGSEVQCTFPGRPTVAGVSSFMSAEVTNQFFGAEIELMGESSLDLNLVLPWVSDPKASSNEAEFIVYRFNEKRPITALRLFTGIDLFTPLLPAVFDVSISGDGLNWSRIATIAVSNPNPEEWLRFELPENTETQFMRFDIPSLRPLRDVFAIAIPEIEIFTTVALTVRRFFDSDGTEPIPVLKEDIAPAGVLTQALCSPWQFDYRDCACFYWAASRPDFVNVDAETGRGHSWMDPSRSVGDDGRPIYGGNRTSYEDVMRDWESKDLLKFIIGGRDET